MAVNINTYKGLINPAWSSNPNHNSGEFMPITPEVVKLQLADLPNKYKSLAEELKQSQANEKERLQNDLKAAEEFQRQEEETAKIAKKKFIGHQAVNDRALLDQLADHPLTASLSPKLRTEMRHGINQKILELSQIIINNQVTKE